MKKIKAVLFDFDGVLIDSLPAMKLSWDSVREKYSVKSRFTEFSNFIGIPFVEILKNLGIEKELFEPIKYHYSKKSSEYRNEIKLNPYTRSILSWLKDNNISVAIVTSKDMRRTKELVEMFDLNIETIVTPELTKRGKPHPDPIFFATKSLSMKLDQTLFIGDMISDMTSAKNAKCHFLFYSMGYEKSKKINYGGVITSLDQIKEFINYI